MVFRHHYSLPRIDMSLMVCMAIFLLVGLKVFHSPLQNYNSYAAPSANNIAHLNAGPILSKMVNEGLSAAAKQKADAAGGVATKIEELEEGMRNGEPYVEGKPWLSKRQPMKYPENA